MGVVDHLVHGYAEGVVSALDGGAEGIAHEDGIDAAFVEQSGGRIVVRGEDGDLLPRFLSFAKGCGADAWHPRSSEP